MKSPSITVFLLLLACAIDYSSTFVYSSLRYSLGFNSEGEYWKNTVVCCFAGVCYEIAFGEKAIS